MTRCVPTLHQAVPKSYVEMNQSDAKRLGIGNSESVRLVSPRGALVLDANIGGRAEPTPGQVFVPFFDEALLINELTLDAFCPISGQPDYKKCSVWVEKA
jgi:nitrate reductase NapA